MISHMSLGVRDFARSGPFYDAVMEPLGYPRASGTKAGELAYGPAGSGVFWLYETPGDGPLASPGTHVAFRVETKDGVHRAAEAAKGFGSTFTREPGPHPDLAPDYYGAIFLDPDGHKLELVVEPAG